jgi:uroporphyrinogen decarboxylase
LKTDNRLSLVRGANGHEQTQDSDMADNTHSRSSFYASRASEKRILIDYLASAESDRQLRNHLGIASESELLDRLGCDCYHLSGRDISQQEGCLPCWRGPRLDTTDTVRTCPLEIKWQRGRGLGKFDVDSAIEGPFTLSSTVQDILDHRWPSARDFDFEPLIAEAEAHSHRVVISGLWSGIFGDSYRMIGFDEFLLAMAMQPELIHAIVDRMTDMCLELNDRLFTQLREKIDVWFFGNDFGTQQALLFSTAMWDDFFGDNIVKLCELAHSHGLKVMMHSCGCVAPLLDRLVDAGVDMLDPVQTTAAGMDPESLMRGYGDRLIFHGGIDTQHVLPTATPEESASHARQMIESLANGLGYIFAPSQIFQTDIPVENIVAVYDVARAYNSDASVSTV